MGTRSFLSKIQITEEQCDKLFDFPINSSGSKAVLEKEAAWDAMFAIHIIIYTP